MSDSPVKNVKAYPQDETLRIRRILRGDREAFRGIVEDYKGLVFHVVYPMVANSADREEICQDVFVKVFEKLDSFAFRSRFSTWIARIAYYHTLNYLRKKKLALVEDFPEPEQGHRVEQEGAWAPEENADYALQQAEMQQAIRREIARLPHIHRTVITLFHLEGLTLADIGEMLDLPQNTVKSHLFRARQRLKEELMDRLKAADHFEKKV